MSIEEYESAAETIERQVDAGLRDAALQRYRCLSDIFIQDSAVDIGRPFYGNSMAAKGRIMLNVQGLFLQ